MLTRLVRTIKPSTNNTIHVHIAEEIKEKGYKRLVNNIDPRVLTQSIDKVEEALHGEELITADQLAKTQKAVIT